MDKVLDRLQRKLRWRLLAPRRSGPALAAACVAHAHQAEWLRTVRAARAQAFGGDDGAPDEDPRSTDAAAWHVIATDALGQVAGALRVFVVDPRLEPLTARDLMAFGHVAFPSLGTEARHVIALERLIERMRGEPCCVYPGGLFTTPSWRASGLGVALVLAAVAMIRLHRTRFAFVFAAARNHTPELFARVGAAPVILHDGNPLAPFHCTRHRCPTQLLAFDPDRVTPQAGPAVDAMCSTLRVLMERTGLERDAPCAGGDPGLRAVASAT